MSAGTVVKEALLGNQGCRYGDRAFPCRWGTPDPSILRSTANDVDLPDGYGKGSRELKRWIEDRMLADARRTGQLSDGARKPFPTEWTSSKRQSVRKKPPKSAGGDGALVRAPGGYGDFPRETAEWIEFNIDYDARQARGDRAR